MRPGTGWNFIIPESAEALAWYDHPFFSNYPAVTLNRFGKGTLLYEGSLFSDQIQDKIIEGAVERAGIQHPDQQFSWPVIAKTGRNGFGNNVHFYYNYSSSEREISYPHPSGKELVTGHPVAGGEALVIKPWDVLIIEEQ